MNTLRRRIFFAVIAAALGSVCLVGVSTKADAGIIPYSVIAPHEYQLPVGDAIPKDGITLLLSYNTFREEGKAWDGDSQSRNLFANVNKLAHIFKIDTPALKDVGFLWEAVTGFASATTKDDQSFTGMIDAQTGLVAWIKPTKNWVTSLEYWLYMPFGDNELSGHSWDHSFASLNNYVLGNFTFDGDFGVKIKGDFKNGGVHAEQGDVFFANAVFAYKFIKQVEPFFKLDYQTTGPGKNKTSGVKTPGQSELAYGIGNQFYITDRLSLALWYEGGLTGRNTTKTNAGYARAIWSF
jgi:hypothetical protein